MKNFLDQVVNQGLKPQAKTQTVKQQKDTSIVKSSATSQQPIPVKQSNVNKNIYSNTAKYSRTQDAIKPDAKDSNAQQKIQTSNKVDNKPPQKSTASNSVVQPASSDKQNNQTVSNINRTKYGRQQQTQNVQQQQKPVHSQSSVQKAHFSRKPVNSSLKHELHNYQNAIVQQKTVYTKLVQTAPVQSVQRVGGYKKAQTAINNQKKVQQKVSITPNKSQFQPNVSSSSNKSNPNINRSPRQSPLNSSRHQKSNIQPVIKQIQQVPKIRSNAIIFCIRKLYAKNMQNAYTQLCKNSKTVSRKNNVLVKLLISSAISTSKAYFTSIQRQFFRKAKAKLDKNLIEQSKIQGKVQSVVTTKSKQLLLNLIELKFKTTLRNSFTSIKRMTDKRQLLAKGLSLLSFLETRKLKQNYNFLRINANRKGIVRQTLMNSLLTIASGYVMRVKKATFQKLIKANLSQLKKASNTNIKSKISEISQNEKSISSHNSQADLIPISQNKKTQAKDDSPYRTNDVFQPSQKTVQFLRNKVEDSKSQFQTQKRSFEQFLEDLRLLIRQNQEHVNNLSEDNKKLKNQSQKLRVPHGQQQNDSFNDREDGYLLKLTQIYKDIFKRSEHPAEMISIRNIIDAHELQLHSLEQDPCILSWNTLKQNSDLKMTVESIEGVQRKRKTALILQQQHKVIENLVRSYVKERYLWEWVRYSINNVA